MKLFILSWNRRRKNVIESLSVSFFSVPFFFPPRPLSNSRSSLVFGSEISNSILLSPPPLINEEKAQGENEGELTSPIKLPQAPPPLSSVSNVGLSWKSPTRAQVPFFSPLPRVQKKKKGGEGESESSGLFHQICLLV